MTTNKTSLFAVLLAIPFALVNGDADAKYCNSGGSKAPAGRYCKALMQFDCAPGCYCTGGGNFTWGVNDVQNGCKNRWSKVTSELNSKGVYLCPGDYPDSPSGASSKNQCFTKSNSGAKVTYGTKVKCDAGQYLPAGETKCSACQSDSVCAGGTFEFSKSSAKGLAKCSGGQVPNSKHTACETSKTTCESGKYLPANSLSCTSCKSRYYLCVGGSFAKSSSDQGIQKCPSGQVSDYNTKKCVAESKPEPAPTPVKEETITCPEGQGLPAGYTSCAGCGQSELCLGGTFKLNQSYNQGYTNCPDYHLPNYTTKKCEQIMVTCQAGQYLEAAQSCRPCKEGHICPGGTYPLSDYDKGAEKCPEGTVPNEQRNQCVNGTSKCEPGTFLPAKGTKCVSCPTSKNYCPGGTFTTTSYDQGLKICPDKSIANSNRTACVLTLSKDEMQYGFKKSSSSDTDEQCWTKKTVEDYVNCMFGGKILVPYTAGFIIKSEEPDSQE